MRLTKEVANKIYDILEDIGASSTMRESFVYTQTHEDCHEWRIEGHLGFGGKFWNDLYEPYEWCVSCYSEDETKKRIKIIATTNKKLKELADEISKNKKNTK
jgi:hypothetical protein